MEPQLAASSPQSSPALPSSEELKAELLDIPEPPDMPPAVTPPGYDDALAGASNMSARNAAATWWALFSSDRAPDAP